MEGWSSILGSGKRFFFAPQRPDRLWVPFSFIANGYPGAISKGVKRLGREADDSPPSSSEVKNDRAIPPLHLTSSRRDA
jgi:hypothetical protein